MRSFLVFRAESKRLGGSDDPRWSGMLNIKRDLVRRSDIDGIFHMTLCIIRLCI